MQCAEEGMHVVLPEELLLIFHHKRWVEVLCPVPHCCSGSVKLSFRHRDIYPQLQIWYRA